MTEGHITAKHPHHPYQRNRLSPDPQALKALEFDAAGLQLKSSWVEGKGHEPPFTNRHSSFAGCIDYVWLSPQLQVVGLLDMPYTYSSHSNDHRSVTFGFTPNEQWPSDHLAMGAELVLVSSAEESSSEAREGASGMDVAGS
jgi:CCR4-NOT transcription complex subunit 6